MTELEKQNTEKIIWEILRGNENIYDKYQPVFTYDNEKETFYMQNVILNNLPTEAKTKLLKIVKGY